VPNIHVGTINAKAPTSVSVGTSSATAVSQTIDRVGLVVTNLSDGTIYLGLCGNTAVLGAGISLTAGGGVWSMDEFSYQNEAVTAIAHSASSHLAIQEFVRVKS
jgi:hypothetical protein